MNLDKESVNTEALKTLYPEPDEMIGVKENTGNLVRQTESDFEEKKTETEIFISPESPSKTNSNNLQSNQNPVADKTQHQESQSSQSDEAEAKHTDNTQFNVLFQNPVADKTQHQESQSSQSDEVEVADTMFMPIVTFNVNSNNLQSNRLFDARDKGTFKASALKDFIPPEDNNKLKILILLEKLEEIKKQSLKHRIALKQIIWPNKITSPEYKKLLSPTELAILSSDPILSAGLIIFSEKDLEAFLHNVNLSRGEPLNNKIEAKHILDIFRKTAKQTALIVCVILGAISLAEALLNLSFVFSLANIATILPVLAFAILISNAVRHHKNRITRELGVNMGIYDSYGSKVDAVYRKYIKDIQTSHFDNLVDSLSTPVVVSLAMFGIAALTCPIIFNFLLSYSVVVFNLVCIAVLVNGTINTDYNKKIVDDYIRTGDDATVDNIVYLIRQVVDRNIESLPQGRLALLKEYLFPSSKSKIKSSSEQGDLINTEHFLQSMLNKDVTIELESNNLNSLVNDPATSGESRINLAPNEERVQAKYQGKACEIDVTYQQTGITQELT